MIVTPSLQKQAADAVVFANGAAARHVKSAEKRKRAQLLVARALVHELRKDGHHIERWVDRALQGRGE